MEYRQKKALGQHWLRDAGVLRSIADAAEVSIDDTVLEVGPGLGTLTEVLTERAKQVVAVEFDHELALYLPIKVKAENLSVVEADILGYDFGNLPLGYKVVANIPYYLTSNLLRILFESNNPPSSGALLVQKEVAERVCARPGQMSLLSVSVQFYCQVSLGQVVPAALFSPRPKVDSQVLLFKWQPVSFYSNVDTNAFFQLVKAGFSERRKKLRGSLSGGLRISKDEADKLLSRVDIDGNLRAQNLSLDDWYKLYLVL